jgi:hypothetical protein
MVMKDDLSGGGNCLANCKPKRGHARR